ncbi:MAG: acylphosphatase [Acidimicrobiales bacterium]
MAGPVIRRRVLVSGRVQGVWFRDSCQRAARRLGVAGWVRNRHDGRVEAVFEGPADEVLSMVNWCGTGPPHAVVSGVELTEEEPVGEAGFAIR